MSNRLRCMLMVLVVVLAIAIPILAQLGSIYDITDIKGPPSSIPMHEGGGTVSTAGQKKADEDGRRDGHSAAVEQGLQSAQRDVVQNLVLRIVNGRGTPLRGMQVRADITTKSRSRTSQSYVTDSNGTVRIKGIKPLPAKVELAFAPDRVLADGRPQWRAASAYQQVLLLKGREGKVVAEASDPPGADVLASDGWGGQVVFASFTRVAARRSTPSARSVVYEKNETIALRREVIDFELTAPADTRVYRPSAGQGEPEYPVGTVGQDGTLRFQLDTYLFGAGQIPLRLAKSLPGGELEAVVEKYPHDPYAGINRITHVPPLVLTRISDVRVSGGFDVLMASSQAKRALGSRLNMTKDPDGSEWWQKDGVGLQVKARKTGGVFGGPSDDGVVERIRLTDKKGGSVAGIGVGDDWTAVSSRLGPPEREDAEGAHYLSNGLIFRPVSGRVASIDLARPTELLTQGTTAFVRRAPITIYVSSFKGDQRCQIRSIADLKRYLSQIGAVKVVNSREAAEYVLSASTAFEGNKSEYLGAVPFKYEARVRLNYTLIGGPDLRRDCTMEGFSKADYNSEVLGGVVTIAVLNKYLKDRDDVPGWLRILIEALLAKVSIGELKESMTRAIQRCPKIAEQSAFNQLSDQLYGLANFRATVTSVDYQKGFLTLNIGTAEGVTRPSSGRQPTVFELYLGRPDPGRSSGEGGLKADYYAAEVVAVSEHQCIAKLKHIVRKVHKSRIELSVTDATDAIKCIPDPASGIVSGRMRVRFLPLS